MPVLRRFAMLAIIFSKSSSFASHHHPREAILQIAQEKPFSLPLSPANLLALPTG
jgi:hypothetical protein